MSADLHRLLGLIESRIGAIRSTETTGDAYKDCQRANSAMTEIVRYLVDVEGASYRRHADTETLRCARISASCTGGPGGLLRNWMSRARKVMARNLESVAAIDLLLDDAAIVEGIGEPVELGNHAALHADVVAERDAQHQGSNQDGDRQHKASHALSMGRHGEEFPSVDDATAIGGVR